MDKNTVSVKIGEEVRTYPAGSTYAEVAADYQDQYEDDILLLYVDGKLQELFKKVRRDCEVKFITARDTVGIQTYRRSLTFLMIKAVYDVTKAKPIRNLRVMYSIGRGYYCEIEGDITINESFLDQVRARMDELVSFDLPIVKRSVSTGEAIRLFHDYGMYDKERLFHYRQASTVNIYSIEKFEDYFYGYMVPRTGLLKYYELYPYEKGFILQSPDRDDPKKVAPFHPQHKLFQVLYNSENWGKLMDVETVGALNDVIAQGKANDLILIQEALQEKRIGDIAEEIASKPEKKFVLIAGPSSSGKTSFANRLSIQLRTHGLKPHPISVDNYFVNREDTPRDENGEYDYECLEALDREAMNRDLTALLAGEEVEMPTFNFAKGKREYLGDKLKMGESDILVIEGIHCLNDELTYQLDPVNKFKVYISALTSLNIDEHNRIPTTDGRLLRRMTRDARTRGTSALETIRRWPSVRRGEEANIFPYQEGADAMFNSALIYELAVLKQYCEPLLYGIPTDCPEYMEAKRLLKFLDYFLGFGSDNLPRNSLLREFVGGSCFNV